MTPAAGVKLIKYEAARTALAEARRVDEAKEIRDKAVALAAYARQAHDQDLIMWATEIKVRAERRAGEMLRETANSERQGKGRPGKNGGSQPHLPTLREMKISPEQSKDWQKLAAIPDREFERRITEAKQEPTRLTTEAILRPTPRTRIDPFEDERHWGPVSEWLREAATLPSFETLKVAPPTGGVATAIRKHLTVAGRYMDGLRQLSEEGKL